MDLTSSSNPETCGEFPDSAKAAVTVLQARGIHRYLGEDEGRVHVLRGVDISLNGGTTYSVVGPSGSGKSTLLYLLGLLDRQDDGELYIGGEKLSDAADRRRTLARNRLLGFVFQFHFLLPEFTALENVILPMRKRAILSEDAMADRAQWLLEQVGLGEKSLRLATRLSGGEQQRVAVARSMANNPAVLLADEPTGNLDFANSRRVFDLMQDLAREQGAAVLFVTHDNDLASKTDVTLKMRDGIFEDE